MIIYIDNMLILDKSPDVVWNHVTAMIALKHRQVHVVSYPAAGVSQPAGELCQSSLLSSRGKYKANQCQGLTTASSRDVNCSQVSSIWAG